MSLAFQPSRPDGHSDRQVLYALASEQPVETIWSHDELLAALSEGLDEPVAMPRLYKAIGAANRDLLKERKRYLAVVRGKGYRLIRADEHLPVALKKKTSAARQIAKGVAVLQSVHMEELSDTQRALHEGQLMIMSGLHMAVVETQRRQSRTEQILESMRAQQAETGQHVQTLTERLEQLENGQ